MTVASTKRQRRFRGLHWSEQHTCIAALLVSIGASAVAIESIGSGPIAWFAALSVTVLAGLATNAFVGGAVSLVASGGAVAYLQLRGLWDDQPFALAALVWLLLIASGTLAGIVGSAVQRGAARQGSSRGGLGGSQPLQGQGSRQAALGVIDAEAALVRLEEERLRARFHLRNLSVIGIEMTSSRDVPPHHLKALRRSVTRVLETVLAPSDIPFAWSESEIGAILPEVDERAAWAYVGPLFAALESATFTVREPDGASKQLKVSTYADFEAAVTGLDLDLDDAKGLLQRARPAGPKKAAA